MPNTEMNKRHKRGNFFHPLVFRYWYYDVNVKCEFIISFKSPKIISFPFVSSFMICLPHFIPSHYTVQIVRDTTNVCIFIVCIYSFSVRLIKWPWAVCNWMCTVTMWVSFLVLQMMSLNFKYTWSSVHSKKKKRMLMGKNERNLFNVEFFRILISNPEWNPSEANAELIWWFSANANINMHMHIVIK